MITFTTVKNTLIDAFNRQVARVLRFGRDDVREAPVSSPFGIDSVPVKDIIAVHAETNVKGKSVVVGYLNRNALAEIGELRMFSTNSSGDEQTFIYLRKNGTIEIGGNVDNMIRFVPLDTALQNYNTLIVTELAKISTAIGNLGGAYAPGPLTIDISNAKIDEVLTR